jgi:flagellar motor protein MotB
VATGTIDLGIHLGATNSRIAVSRAEGVTLIPNGDGADSTPTAVWIDDEEQLVVGARALSRIRTDPDNVHTDFVKLLGSGELLRFARSAQVADPTDLVAAVIRSLCADAGRRLGRVVEDAVITAPARFAPAQRQALAVAARKAGLVSGPLLQEPIAAALAYGGPSEGATWLVYHFAGSSFDAALVTRQNGAVQVTSHAYDDRLGGDQLDWEIVRKVFVPAVFQEAQVTGFHSDNPQWRLAFAALREAAEDARIRLESEPSTEVRIRFLCRDDAGAPVPFRLTLDRTDLNRLLRVSVRRSLKVCEGLLKKRGLKYGDLERVVLAGGPVHDPFFAESLTGAGVTAAALAGGVAPLAVIAEGAALYAGRESAFRAAPPMFVEGEEAVPEPPSPPEPTSEPEAGPAAEEEAEPEAGPAAEEEAELVAETEKDGEAAPEGEEEPEADSEGYEEAEAEPEGDEGPHEVPATLADAGAEVAEEQGEAEAQKAAQEPTPAIAGPEAQEPEERPTAEAEAVELEEAPAAGDVAGTSEESTIALAASHARAGRHTDAKNVLRRLGPGDKLSPAALDMLIRVYTDQGRHDMAQLVWRVGKSRDVVEGDAYDAEYYALAKAPVAAPESEGAAEQPTPASEVTRAVPFAEATATEVAAEEPAPATEAIEVEAATEGRTSAVGLDEWEPTVPSQDSGITAPPSSPGEPSIAEAEAIALALSFARAGRYPEAKHALRQLGPGDELSPAALDVLIRLYTGEGRSERAELVWSFAKGRGLVEDETYDAKRYTLEDGSPESARQMATEQHPMPTGEVGSGEAEVVAAAARDTGAGRYAAAQGRLLSLGPVEELSPAAFDMLIRSYAAEGRGDRAELVWRFGKSRGLVEGEAYDPERYTLDGTPTGGEALSRPDVTAAETPEPSDEAEGSWAAASAKGSFIDKPLAPGPASVVWAEAANDEGGPPQGSGVGSSGDGDAGPPESADGRGAGGWRPWLIVSLIVGVTLLVLAAILLVRGCDSTAGEGPTASAAPTASSASTTSSPTASATASPSSEPTPSPEPTGTQLDVPGTTVDVRLDVPGTTVDLRDTLIVTFDAGLFPSGFAEPSAEGLRTLQRLAAELASFRTAIAVRVIGSADSVPVGPNCGYADNTELALARAETVVDLLHLEAGLPYTALSAMTIDPSHPLAGNSTDDGRARNRTVLLEISGGGT